MIIDTVVRNIASLSENLGQPLEIGNGASQRRIVIDVPGSRRRGPTIPAPVRPRSNAETLYKNPAAYTPVSRGACAR
jgi:hypothetical protein